MAVLFQSFSKVAGFSFFLRCMRCGLLYTVFCFCSVSVVVGGVISTTQASTISIGSIGLDWDDSQANCSGDCDLFSQGVGTRNDPIKIYGGGDFESLESEVKINISIDDVDLLVTSYTQFELFWDFTADFFGDTFFSASLDSTFVELGGIHSVTQEPFVLNLDPDNFDIDRLRFGFIDPGSEQGGVALEFYGNFPLLEQEYFAWQFDLSFALTWHPETVGDVFSLDIPNQSIDLSISPLPEPSMFFLFSSLLVTALFGFVGRLNPLFRFLTKY